MHMEKVINTSNELYRIKLDLLEIVNTQNVKLPDTKIKLLSLLDSAFILGENYTDTEDIIRGK